MSDARSDIFAHLGILSEAIRVRLLRLLEVEELGVGELTRIVQLPQSTVSRHLKVLLVGGWIQRRSEGSSSWVSMAPDKLDDEARQLWALLRDSPGGAEEATRDAERMTSVLAQRSTDSRAFFGRVAAHWDQLRQQLYGHAFELPTLLGLLPPDWVVADLGCGTGQTVGHLAPVVRQVIGVDQEQAMLDAAHRRLDGIDNVTLVQAELSQLPLPDESVDAALVTLVLHHLPSPQAALAEASRVLRAGGQVVVTDMLAHDREEYRHRMGHLHLGFSRETIAGYAEGSRLRLERFDRIPADPDAQGPALFVARLVRAAR